MVPGHARARWRAHGTPAAGACLRVRAEVGTGEPPGLAEAERLARSRGLVALRRVVLDESFTPCLGFPL